MNPGSWYSRAGELSPCGTSSPQARVAGTVLQVLRQEWKDQGKRAGIGKGIITSNTQMDGRGRRPLHENGKNRPRGAQRWR